MGVQKIITQEGTGATPQVGQTVTIEYTGYLRDPSKPNEKGNQFDSSVGRGDFKTPIGVGRVIKGWDEGVTQMKIGEKATLVISSDYGYGNAFSPPQRECHEYHPTPLHFPTTTDSFGRPCAYETLYSGFPGLIPAGSDLIFDVWLKAAN
ncbi:peptidyl-prolyl cis-trans isomerase fkr-3 [Dactylonectria estremocensis]|uniref:peptidylprolyl isomerase n=1 Tax=Dactylonectria estremocensis TaxID=1079267 RepID=A0A9P9F208_9HYPO|nr:peptidyl-prolyl cis-trans isomerase fkr-3 [Dactylonectria estremocensis]